MSQPLDAHPRHRALRPTVRAGLLALGATLSEKGGNLPGARSMISQMASHHLICADTHRQRRRPDITVGGGARWRHTAGSYDDWTVEQLRSS